MKLNSWAAIETEVERITREAVSEPFEKDTIANSYELLAFARAHCPLPSSIAKGYWSTLCFTWGSLEIEVFGNRFEIYRYYDRRTDIGEVRHIPGSPFPSEIATVLPRLSPT